MRCLITHSCRWLATALREIDAGDNEPTAATFHDEPPPAALVAVNWILVGAVLTLVAEGLLTRVLW